MGGLELFRRDNMQGKQELKKPVGEPANDNYDEADIEKAMVEIKTLHAGILKLIEDMEVKSEHIATLRERFFEVVEKTREKLPPHSALWTNLDDMEHEIDTAIQDEWGEGALKTEER